MVSGQYELHELHHMKLGKKYIFMAVARYGPARARTGLAKLVKMGFSQLCQDLRSNCIRGKPVFLCTTRYNYKHGGATTTGPDATYPPAICQNSGGGGSGRGNKGFTRVSTWGMAHECPQMRGGGGLAFSTHVGPPGFDPTAQQGISIASGKST